MTKSTITREQLIKKAQEQIEFCRHTKITGEGRAHVNQCAALFEIALAALDSEPVAYMYDGEDGTEYNGHNEFSGGGKGIALYRHAQPTSEREQVRREHAEWSQATFGNVGPTGPLKHLSKEALEAAAEPGDLSEWADMQFLLWDAQRRAGITDEQITQAMIEKLAVNKQRSWPEPKDGEPRLHIKAQPAPVVPEKATVGEMPFLGTSEGAYVRGWNDCRAAMLNHPSSIQPNTDAAPGAEIKHPSSNSPVIPEGYVMVPKEPTAEMVIKMRYHVGGYDRNIKEGYKAMLAAAQQEVKGE